MLTVLLGAGLYVLMTLFNIVFYGAASLLGIDFEVEIGEWPVRGILVATAIDTGFFIAALVTGKYLLTRLTAVDRVRGGVKSILAILLLGLGLVVLRRAFHFLFVGLALSLAPPSVYDETAGLINAVVAAIDLGLMIVAVALGRHVIAREVSKECAEIRQ